MIRTLKDITTCPRALTIGLHALKAGVLAATLILSGCASTSTAKYGVQPTHEGFVPARTGILPCQLWPKGAVYTRRPATNVSDSTVADLCAQLDQFVIESFDNQPYMPGFSPKFVAKALDASKLAAANDTIAKLWRTDEEILHRCAACDSAPGVYTNLIAATPEWQAWLASASTAIRNADALLVPFVLNAAERRFNDRGLAIAERQAGVLLLLIDTANGALIWSGGRNAAVPIKRLTGGQIPDDLLPPPWDAVTERLKSEDLWRDYPGRQIF